MSTLSRFFGIFHLTELFFVPKIYDENQFFFFFFFLHRWSDTPFPFFFFLSGDLLGTEMESTVFLQDPCVRSQGLTDPSTGGLGAVTPFRRSLFTVFVPLLLLPRDRRRLTSIFTFRAHHVLALGRTEKVYPFWLERVVEGCVLLKVLLTEEGDDAREKVGECTF